MMHSYIESNMCKVFRGVCIAHMIHKSNDRALIKLDIVAWMAKVIIRGLNVFVAIKNSYGTS